MKNIRSYSTIFAGFCFTLLFSALAGTASAQGRYANVYSNRDVSGFITNLENSSDEFRRDFDRAMDNSPINGSSAERRFNTTVKNFENSVDRLRRNFDRQNTWWSSRNQVQDMMSNARPVNIMMNTLQFRRQIERQWNALRRDVNKLADTYDLPDLAGVGGGGGGGNPGGGGNAPNWTVGTFSGRHPQYGGTITLTVERNGSVRSDYQGAVSYGTINGQNLYMEGVSVRVTRLNNGFSTRRADNGEVVEYYRGGIGGGDGNPGGGGNAPNWAVGTFYGRDPATGRQITFTVARNGSVSSSSQGAVSYGTMNGENLYMEGVSVRVTRVRNGIRTTRADNGQVVEYYKR